ncbi:hypothetical protein HDF09_000623 [Edaphobacter lichenicola]|uniref:Uncharacterized protein n=1 Tax=Tunturiibacter empetritectus TaxID=3069691 RepID=A0A7W8MPY7_9BACT|nr:hypothetical protein [Edaphobacter lichenicola]
MIIKPNCMHGHCVPVFVPTPTPEIIQCRFVGNRFRLGTALQRPACRLKFELLKI